MHVPSVTRPAPSCERPLSLPMLEEEKKGRKSLTLSSMILILCISYIWGLTITHQPNPSSTQAGLRLSQSHPTSDMLDWWSWQASLIRDMHAWPVHHAKSRLVDHTRLHYSNRRGAFWPWTWATSRFEEYLRYLYIAPIQAINRAAASGRSGAAQTALRIMDGPMRCSSDDKEQPSRLHV